MSLDVYLTLDSAPTPPIASAGGSGIYVRENGSTREISRAEWDERFPDREPLVVMEREERSVFSANITHNLNRMADAAGIYESLWRPDECGFVIAAQLIGPLRAGLERLRADPGRFEHLNPGNGWGTYDGLVRFVANYLDACEQWPSARVTVSR